MLPYLVTWIMSILLLPLSFKNMAFEVSNFPSWKLPNEIVPYDTYCKDENSDHKVGIYCNLIGPLDQS